MTTPARSILGAGILGYPYCFKSSGLVLATCIMLVSMAACRFSYQLLLYCSQLSTKRSYEDLAEQAVGKIGRHMVSLCTAAVNLGSIVAYLNILAGGWGVPMGVFSWFNSRKAARSSQVQTLQEEGRPTLQCRVEHAWRCARLNNTCGFDVHVFPQMCCRLWLAR